MSHPHIVLVANYQPDRQYSMLRFSGVLEHELRKRGLSVSVVAPAAILGPEHRDSGAVAKWLGYVDKFVLFPWRLRAEIARLRRRGADLVVHVCDHSNAMYTRALRDVPHLVTCHDLLAVRSARGEFPHQATRWSGRIFQWLILSGLNRAQQLVCISDATSQDVMRLCGVPDAPVRLVYMGLNFPFAAMRPEEAQPRVARLLSTDRPFVLHVGGNQWYKNRLGVLKIYAEVKSVANGSCPALAMVGAPFTAAMRDFVVANGLAGDVLELVEVEDADLQALYSRAELLLYPSLAEGFGWPVVEAMACGCRVVTSGRAPMTEIGGVAAAYIEPEDVETAAAIVLRVLEETADAREARVQRGLREQRRFSTERMIDRYLDLYRTLPRPV